MVTGADYGYWKRQEERWAAMAEGAPDETAREYIYGAFEKSSQALAGLEKALLALGLLDQGKELDLRSPHQDFVGQMREPDGTWIEQDRNRLYQDNDHLLSERNQLLRERNDLQRKLDGARANISRLNEHPVQELFPGGLGRGM